MRIANKTVNLANKMRETSAGQKPRGQEQTPVNQFHAEQAAGLEKEIDKKIVGTSNVDSSKKFDAIIKSALDRAKAGKKGD